MAKKNPLKFFHKLAARYRIEDGKRFRLKHADPADTWKFDSQEGAKELLGQGVQMLSDLQERLYAQDKWAVLLIFQAMDAAGKDGTIKHVLSGVNPQGCEVFSFKAPSAEELNHDFLWRTSRALPERGRIGIFNRSYYEEMLVVRVHPKCLENEKLPAELMTQQIWKHRFEDINGFERYLCRNGVLVQKFFLHVSKGEQKRRFLSRLEESEKNWKFSLADAREREFWSEYQAAYEEVIRRTSAEHAPWYVVPADNKWFTRLVVAAAIIDALDALNLRFPKVDKKKKRELAAARVALEGR